MLAPALSPAFMLAPDIVKIQAVAGGCFERAVTVTNDANDPVTITVQPETWIQPVRPASLENWFAFEPRRLVVRPHGRETVRIKGRIPADLAGEYLVMLFFASENPSANIKLQTRLGVPLYICRRGTELRRAEVGLFRPAPGAPGREPVLEVQLLNSGNVHLAPFGAVLLKQNGRIVGQREVRFSEPLFPGQTGKTEVRFGKQQLPGGTYQAELQVFLDNVYARDPKIPLEAVSAQCQVSIP